MAKSIAVAAALCASASAFMTPTPLSRAPAANDNGVSRLVCLCIPRLYVA